MPQDRQKLRRAAELIRDAGHSAAYAAVPAAVSTLAALSGTPEPTDSTLNRFAEQMLSGIELWDGPAALEARQDLRDWLGSVGPANAEGEQNALEAPK